MHPFPRDIKVPKYDKYDVNGDPHDHVRHFYALSMDFMHEDAFLMHLFHRILRGQAMEWFTKLSPPLKTFDELAQHFIQQYSYIQHPVTVLDIFQIKKKLGEPFAIYLQWWRSLYSWYPWQVLEAEKIDIFVNTLVPELYFDLRKQLFTSFNTMVESTYHIEDVSIKKGDIVINKDKANNGNGKDKGKPWNKKKYVVNDGVVDTPKTKEFVFNLSNAIYATKQQEGSKPQTFDKGSKFLKKRCVYTPMVEPYEVVLKTLIANKLVTFPDNSCPYDPPIRPPWWREDHTCSYHQNKGHNTENCFKLKDVIQDLIEAGKVVTDGLVKIFDHKAFKKPLPEYEKVESSKATKNNHDAKISYAYADTDNVISILEPIEYICMASLNNDNWPNYDFEDE